MRSIRFALTAAASLAVAPICFAQPVPALYAPVEGSDPYEARALVVDEVGDVNGDGVSDVVVGKGWQDVSRADVGALWILESGSDCGLGSGTRITRGEGGLSLKLLEGDRFGASVAPLGDLDGDGVVDLVVGVPGYDGGGWRNSGALAVLFLRADGSVAREQLISATRGGLRGFLFEDSQLGHRMAVMGDVDGDGVDEIAVAVASDPGVYAGFVLSFGPDGSVMREQAIAPTLAGDDWLGERFVAALAGAGAPFSMLDPSTVTEVVELTGSDPMANFDATGTMGQWPLSVDFQDLSTGTGLSGWSWDFDDDHFSLQQNPTHPFYLVRSYDIALTVTGTFGTDTAIRSEFVTTTGGIGQVRVNGNDVNAEIYESITAPDFGTLWESRITASVIGGSGLTFIFSYADWLEPTLTQFGELLVNVNSTFYNTSIVAVDDTTGYASHFVPIPLDANIFGLGVFTQGFVNNLGMGNAGFTNALYIVLGTGSGG